MRWIKIDRVLAIHSRQIAEHGSIDGVRDIGLLESALARPLNIYSYEPKADAHASQPLTPLGSLRIIHSSTATNAPDT